ncbi:MAG: DMT family transporter [Oscillospiraceae bacterium]
MKKKIDLSPLWIALAGILWGLMGIFVRRFNEYGVESMSIVFLRSLFTSAAALLFCLVTDRKSLKIKPKDIWVFIGTGLVSIVFFNYCYFTAINMMSLSAAAILLYTSPIFVTVLSAVIFKEKITPKKLIAIVLSIGGLVLVTGIIGSDTPVSGLGISYGIMSAIGYALYSIFTRSAINRGYSSFVCIGYSFLTAAVFSAFFADMNAIGEMISSSPSMIGFTLIFTVVSSIAPYFLYNLGLKGTENGKAAVIASVEPVAATLLGILLYNEIPTPSAAVGIILVFAAMVLSI